MIKRRRKSELKNKYHLNFWKLKLEEGDENSILALSFVILYWRSGSLPNFRVHSVHKEGFYRQGKTELVKKNLLKLYNIMCYASYFRNAPENIRMPKQCNILFFTYYIFYWITDLLADPVGGAGIKIKIKIGKIWPFFRKAKICCREK